MSVYAPGDLVKYIPVVANGDRRLIAPAMTSKKFDTYLRGSHERET